MDNQTARSNGGVSPVNSPSESEVGNEAKVYMTWYDSIREIRIIAHETSGKEWTELINKVRKCLK